MRNNVMTDDTKLTTSLYYANLNDWELIEFDVVCTRVCGSVARAVVFNGSPAESEVWASEMYAKVMITVKRVWQEGMSLDDWTYATIKAHR